MKKKLIFLIFMLSSLFLFSVTVFAAPSPSPTASPNPSPSPGQNLKSSSTPGSTVDIYPNLAKVVIDGEKTNVQTVLFQDKVYIAVRDLSNALGMKISWDGNSNTVSINSAVKKESNSVVQSFLYIIARALQLAGLVLLIQAAFFRSKKDFYFVKKYNSSQTSLRRLAHTAGTTRMGIYYVSIGTLITFFVSGNGISYAVSIAFIIILTLIFWFLGLGAANSTTKQSNLDENVDE